MSDKKSKDQTVVSRRKFLLGVGTGAAAVGAAVVAGRPASHGTEPQVHADIEPVKGKGYQVSSHVQNYYRTLKV